MSDRMTAVQYRAMHSRQKKAGRIRGTVRTRVGSMWFDSALEAARYAELLLLEKSGQIADLRCQVSIPLKGQEGPVLTPTGRQMHYRADFIYRDKSSGAEVIEDAKGFRTEQYRIKRAILNAMGFKISEIERTKTSGKR